MNDCPCGQVENHCEVAVALANADLIDGNGTQVPQLWGFKPLFQVPFLSVFDDIPAYVQVPGDILDCHMA
jgi:hypothetical protein